VRGIQTHSHDVEVISAGQRAAVNLAGIHHHEITRGHELATPGYLLPSQLFTATIRLLPDSPWPIRHRGQVRLHLGTQERIATVSLLNGTDIQPGGLADVQLAVDEPTVAAAGQPLVVRSVSPLHTLGGGHVLQPVAARLHRRDTESPARLADLKASQPDDRAAAAIYFYGTNSWSSLDLARDARLTRAQADHLAAELRTRGTLIGGSIHRDIVHRIETSLLESMEKLHAQNPAAPAIERARLLAVARRWGEARVINTLIDDLIGAGRLSGDEHTVALPRFQPRLTATQARLRELVLNRYRSCALAPPDLASVQREAQTSDAELRRVIDLCLAEGALVHLAQGMLLHREAEAELRRRVGEIFTTRDRATLSEIRQLLGTTRKYALPFCEYLDRIGLTRRTADVRELCCRQASHV
jgi:selenocysteine-specific elongation factor